MSVSFGSCTKFRNLTTSYRRRRNRSPGTPLVHWKFDDKQRASGGRGATLSARKFAAGLWKLRLLAQLSGGGGKKCNQPHAKHVNTNMLPLHRSSREYSAETKILPQSPLHGFNPSNKIPHKFASSLPYPKSTMEGATKWDPRCSKLSTEAYCFYSYRQCLEGQFATFSVVSALRAELLQARLQIHGLKDELRSCKKKYEHLTGKLGEERNSWQSTHNKMRAIIDNLKDELSIGRRSQKRIEIVNSELVKELADAKSSAKQLLQDYDKEKKIRELMEEVCNELAKKIGEDKAEMEVLKTETNNIREEVEEERRMLQLAEIWREERVQMKLVDAKLALEYKYSQMNNLVTDLEYFLRSRSETLDVMEFRKVEMMIQAIKSVTYQDMMEFHYVSPKSSGLFSSFDRIREGEANDGKMDPLIKSSPIHDASNHHTASLQDDFSNNYVLNHSNVSSFFKDGLEEEARIGQSGSHIEDQGSRYSLKGSDHSAIRVNESRIASSSKMESNEKVFQDSPKTEMSELCSISGEQPMEKLYAVSKLRRSLTRNSDLCKITSGEVYGRLANGTVSSVGAASPHRRSLDSGLRQQQYSVGWLASPDSKNPHITRGMKGSIEWPRGIQKNKFKAKCLKAMIKSQKTQLQNLLK